MRPPSAVIKRSKSGGGRFGTLCRCDAGERAMNALSVARVLNLGELLRQVHRIPEEYSIEVLTPDRPNEGWAGPDRLGIGS
jgi:hypothetical protein